MKSNIRSCDLDGKERFTNFSLEASSAGLMLLLFLALVLGIWGMFIHDATIIAFEKLSAILLCGFIITLVILFLTARHLLNGGWTIVLSLIYGCCFTYYLLMFLNREIPVKKLQTAMFAIKTTGNFAYSKGCASPYAIVNFDQIRKRIRFPCEFQHDIQEYSKVRLEYYYGFFGLPVIERKVLIK